ncbi:MAG: MFS transporter [candidate division NC10 bacterium]|nr:MFS transporter [candidate division NC10 bacterium]
MIGEKPPSGTTAGGREPSKKIGRNIYVLGGVSLLTDVSTEMIYPFLPAFLTKVLGASPTFVGLVEGIAETTASLVKLLSGWLSDRLKRRKSLVVTGYTLSSTTRPFMAIAAFPWHVLALRFVDRVGKGLRTSPRDALIADSTDEAIRGKAFGFHRAMDHLGAVFGPLIAFLLLPLVGGSLRAIFWLSSIPAALSVAILISLVQELPPKAAKEPSTPAFRLKPFDRRFTTFLPIVALFTLGNSSDAFLLLRAEQVGVASAHLPLLWLLLHVVKSGSAVPGGILSDRFGRKVGIISGWIVYGAAYLGFANAEEVWQIWGLFAFYGLFFGLTEGVERALVADLVPAHAQATAFGLYHATIGFAALPASLLMGSLWERFGAPFAFTFGASLALFAAVLFLFLVETRGR